MPLVQYVANPSPSDGTGEILLATTGTEARVLVLDGPAIEITGEEFQSIVANGYQLVVVDDEADDTSTPDPTPSSSPSPPATPTQSTGASSPTPTTPSGA
jgi:hypothetical protein